MAVPNSGVSSIHALQASQAGTGIVLERILRMRTTRSQKAKGIGALARVATPCRCLRRRRPVHCCRPGFSIPPRFLTSNASSCARSSIEADTRCSLPLNPSVRPSLSGHRAGGQHGPSRSHPSLSQFGPLDDTQRMRMSGGRRRDLAWKRDGTAGRRYASLRRGMGPAAVSDRGQRGLDQLFEVADVAESALQPLPFAGVEFRRVDVAGQFAAARQVAQLLV